MNAATIIEDPEAYVAQRKKFMRALYVLWGTLIGEHQPSEENFYQWLDSFGVQTVADAIKRTSHKARQRARQHDPMDLKDLEKYCTATARNMRQSKTVYAVQPKYQRFNPI